MLPWRWGDPQARQLKPWARIVVTVWVLFVVPLLLSSLAIAVIALPRLMGTAWASLDKQQDVLAAAWADGDMIQATARVLAMIAIVIPVAGVVYLLIRLVRAATSGHLARHRRQTGDARRWPSCSAPPCWRSVAYAWPPRGQLPADPAGGARHDR